MGDQDHAAREGLQVVLQPGHGLRVQVVGRFVEQQHVGLRQQQAGERDAALLTPRQLVDGPVGRRRAQGVHGHLDAAVDVPQVAGVDLLLEGVHLLHQLVGVVLAELRRDGVVAVEDLLLLALRDDVAPHVERLVQVRLLRQVPALDPVGGLGLAGIFAVDPRHDLEQGRLAGAVDAHHADLGVGVEGQPDVLEHLLAARVGLGQALHLENELCSHGRARSSRGGRGLAVQIAGRRPRGNGGAVRGAVSDIKTWRKVRRKFPEGSRDAHAG